MRRIGILTTLTVVFLSFLAPIVEARHHTRKTSRSAQKKPTTLEKELETLYEKLLLASKTKNEAVLKQILADNYSQVTADGRVRTKDSRIKETISEQDLENELITLESFKVFIYKNAAVARCLVRNKGTSGGKPFDSKILSTATFVKESKGWQIAATHLSFVKE